MILLDSLKVDDSNTLWNSYYNERESEQPALRIKHPWLQSAISFILIAQQWQSLFFALISSMTITKIAFEKAIFISLWRIPLQTFSLNTSMNLNWKKYSISFFLIWKRRDVSCGYKSFIESKQKASMTKSKISCIDAELRGKKKKK